MPSCSVPARGAARVVREIRRGLDWGIVHLMFRPAIETGGHFRQGRWQLDGRGQDVVIWNPHSGKRRGRRRMARLRDRLGSAAEFWETTGPGDAERLAREAAHAGYTRVYACGGDGTVHEVVNGLLAAVSSPGGRDSTGSNSAVLDPSGWSSRRHPISDQNQPVRQAPGSTNLGLPGLAENRLFSDLPELVVVPVGSANDYAYSLRNEARQAGRSPGETRPVDVGQISSSSGHRRWFVVGVGVGLNGIVTAESRHIQNLQGVLLYGLATARALWKLERAPEMAVQLNGGVPLVGPTMLLSVLLSQREGNFVLAPQARLGDGWFDVVHAALNSRWEALRLLPRIALWGLPLVYPSLTRSLCQTVRVSAPEPLVAHADGELFCVAADGVTELEIEILPGRLQVALWEE